jgi:hypothetical protein
MKKSIAGGQEFHLLLHENTSHDTTYTAYLWESLAGAR